MVQFASYLRRVLCRTRLIFPRINGPIVSFSYMFWTDWGTEPKVERAEMDGSNRQVIIQQNIQWPNGLTLDYNNQKLFWTDARLRYIAMSNYDGSNREKIFRSPDQCALGHLFGITLYENRLFWTDWSSKGIHSTDRDNTTGKLQCKKVWQSTGLQLFDVRVFDPTTQLPRPGELLEVFNKTGLSFTVSSTYI